MEQKKPAQERLGLLGQNVKGHLDIGEKDKKTSCQELYCQESKVEKCHDG